MFPGGPIYPEVGMYVPRRAYLSRGGPICPKLSLSRGGPIYPEAGLSIPRRPFLSVPRRSCPHVPTFSRSCLGLLWLINLVSLIKFCYQVMSLETLLRPRVNGFVSQPQLVNLRIVGQRERGRARLSIFSFFFFTLMTGPRSFLSLERSDSRVYGPQIRSCLSASTCMHSEGCKSRQNSALLLAPESKIQGLLHSIYAMMVVLRG